MTNIANAEAYCNSRAPDGGPTPAHDHVSVTLKPKCYVYVCAGCGLLASSERSDALTCSGACRVRAHRNGELNRVREIARQWEITASSILQSKALSLLRPDLENEIMAGRLTLEDARGDVYRAFIELLLAATDGAAL
jgi:hypothetical protein